MLTFRCGAARTVTAFFVLFLFYLPDSVSQITIREKISISPGKPQAVQFETPTNQSFLRFTYLRRSEATGRIEIQGPCGIDTSAESPGNPVSNFSSTVVLIDPAPPGAYTVTVSAVPPNQPISAITVVIENENGFVASRGLSVPGAFQQLHLYFTGYSLSATKDLIEPNQSNRFFAEPVRECIATRFNTGGPLTLRIIEGAEFGQFYRVEFVFFPEFEIRFIPLGTEITAFSSQLQEIDYIADGATPPPGVARVVAQAEWNGVFEADTFFVQGPPAFDHFAVGLEEDTIAFTETSKIFVQAKDPSNNDIGLDGSVLLRLSIDSTLYGSFIAANGDTVPSPLSNVLYSDAKAGNIRFAAVNKNPDSLVNFRVIAKLQEDTTRTGDTTLVLLEQTLKIVMTAPREVRPTISTENNEQTLVGDRQKEFAVKMTKGGKAVSNHMFRLRTNYVRKSGGHDHGDTPSIIRADNNDNYGFFTASGSDIRRRPLDDVTGIDGQFRAVYYSSAWGDTMKILLESRINNLLKDSTSVVEKVSNLEELPVNANYVPIGGTCNHHGSSDNPGVPDSCRAPNNNHWANSTTIVGLEGAAESWHRDFPSEAILLVNDLSLPFGGGFDINGLWAGAHETHRTGTDSDIRSDLFYFLNNALDHRIGIPVRLPRNEPFNTPSGALNPRSRLVRNTAFERMCRANGGEAEIHLANTRLEHYHINFD